MIHAILKVSENVLRVIAVNQAVRAVERGLFFIAQAKEQPAIPIVDNGDFFYLVNFFLCRTRKYHYSEKEQ